MGSPGFKKVANDSERLKGRFDHISNQGMLTDITPYINLASVQAVEELHAQVKSILCGLGFSDFFFGIFAGQDIGSITTLPSDICNACFTGEQVKNNVLVEHTQKCTTPFFLSEIIAYMRQSPIKTNTFELCEQLYDEMMRYRFYDCYNVPRPCLIGNLSAIFLVADKGTSTDRFRKKVKHHRPVLRLLVEIIANIGLTSFPTHFSNDTPNDIAITPRPLSLLNILAKENVTLKHAAERLSISLDTANKHIAAAKNALGANTQAAAIYQAIKLGILEVEHN